MLGFTIQTSYPAEVSINNLGFYLKPRIILSEDAKHSPIMRSGMIEINYGKIIMVPAGLRLIKLFYNMPWFTQ